MAELQIIIHPNTYDDGDILLAHSDHDCRRYHAEHVCFEKQGNRLKDMDGNGIMPVDHLSEDFMQATCRISIERVSKSEAIITLLSDGSQVIVLDGVEFSNPFDDGKIQSITLDPFFMLRRRSQLYPVFGTVGRERVYCDPFKIHDEDTIAESVWGRIKEKTGKHHADKQHKWMPKGDLDLKHFLVIPVPDFEPDEGEEFIIEDADSGKKRKNCLNNWKRFARANKEFKKSLQVILDKNRTVDLRQEIPPLDDAEMLVEKVSGKKRKIKAKPDKLNKKEKL